MDELEQAREGLKRWAEEANTPRTPREQLAGELRGWVFWLPAFQKQPRKEQILIGDEEQMAVRCQSLWRRADNIGIAKLPELPTAARMTALEAEAFARKLLRAVAPRKRRAQPVPSNRGRLSKEDGKIRRAEFLAILRQHPTFLDDPARLVELLGVSERTIRRWLWEEEQKYLDSRARNDPKCRQ